ncbi:MAG: UDP-N-acetylglucosamine 2-epimerase [Polyangiaceae bacterium]|nr:UDP-N-acetylglucosamine 2-epimerase [Polyangiaceae bacterium]
MKKVLFLTGTRADFGKLKSLIKILDEDGLYDIHLFTTGMHMLRKYGYTTNEVEKLGIGQVYKYINQNENDSMEVVLSKTILGLSDYIKENPVDMIIVHGDRVEALAGAIVGSLHNTLVAHIEGGEVSGTIDELIRHSVSKMSHLHFTSNEEAAGRLLQLGEQKDSIHIIGSPDMDVMDNANLPTMNDVKERYNIPFENYGILLYHPVTTEYERAEEYAKIVVEAVLTSGKNYVVIYPNNDLGSSAILREYQKLTDKPHIRIFPSMRFEYFLTLMKYCNHMLGNSSAGVREAPHYGRPSVNIGSRQDRRANAKSIVNCHYSVESIVNSIKTASEMTGIVPERHFGDGESNLKFSECLRSPKTWATSLQKVFVDR